LTTEPPCKDEARVGQKTTITRRWARRGTRPSAPKDQRTASAYLFGAICPAEGKGAAIVMPRCDTAAMSLHLAEISTAVAADAHAVVLLDQAGWHVAKDLVIPCVDGSPLARVFLACLRSWSVRPCVRPVDAALTWPLAVMPSPRVRVPTRSLHSKDVRWDDWVFLPRRCRPFSASPAWLPFPICWAPLRPVAF
jgi:hypothetical protein